MIFFPSMYEDELLYSVIARYHIRSGNMNYSHTSTDIFGRKTVKSSVYMPSNISNLIKNLPENCCIDEIDLINNHTMFPFYTAFLSPDASNKISNSMMKDSGVDIYSRAGICASKISIPEYFKFCHKCMEEDLEKYGETYWHRIHQIQCVEVCPKHKTILQNSTVKINSYYKQEYIAADVKNCIIDKEVNYASDTIDKLYNLSKDIEYLLTSNFERRNIEWHRNNYINYMMDAGLATPKGRIRQDKLVSEFKEFYGDEFLNLVQSNIEYKETSNWVSEICRKTRYNVHPVRQLLFIRFLKLKLEDFFNTKYEYKPFGDGPWPCLNKASNHYRENTIKDVKINYSRVTKRITGTFCCECGYKYLKEKFSDNLDLKEKTRVLDFGDVWKKKLTDLVLENQLNVQEIADILGLDWNSTYKHIIKLGLSDNFNTNNKKLNQFKNNDNINNNFKDRKHNIHDYRNKMLGILNENATMSRTQIKTLNRSLYVYLQKNDREWLEMHLPEKRNGKSNQSNVDWHKRDNEILMKVQNLVDNLMNTDERPKRINMNRIGKTLNIYDMLTKHKDKLPKTTEYLNEVIESRHNYTIRKIKWAIKKIGSEDTYLNVESVVYIDFIDKEIKNHLKKSPFSY